jgi:FMN reductase
MADCSTRFISLANDIAEQSIRYPHMNILLLAGSPSNPSRSTRLLDHAGEKLTLLGHRHTKLQVRDLPAQALLHADFADIDLKVAKAQVEQADAIIVATPVYKAAYSGILKAFLDLLPQNGLAGKLILPLATGGSQSHMLALDYALRPVLSSLAARHVLPSIYATDAQIEWYQDQGLVLDPGIARRVAEGVAHLSASLQALQEAPSGEFAAVPFSQVRCSV